MSDFTSKVQPIKFKLRDTSGGIFMLQADLYLLNDILNKDKFFLAMKFTDLNRKVWIRTRVSMNTQTIYENINPVLREWLLVEKAVETSFPLVSQEIDKLKDLFQYRMGRRLPTCLLLTPKEELTVELIIAKILYFFQHKFCICEKINGTALAVQNSSLKKVASLNSYLHAKHAPKIPGLWKSILKVPPLPWELLQKLDKEFVGEDDVPPVLIRFGPMFDPLEPRVITSRAEILGSEFGESPSIKILMDHSEMASTQFVNHGKEMEQKKADQINSSKKKVKRLSIPETAKAFIRLKQAQRTYHGWQKSQYVLEDCIPKIRSQLLTVVLKVKDLFWLNTVAIDVKEKEEDSDDIIEDFEVKLIQTHFPYKTDKKWVGSGNINDMPKALNINRKILLDYLGAKLGGTRVFLSQIIKIKHHIVDFIGRNSLFQKSKLSC